MPWFMVDDKLHSHPKAVRAGVPAMGLWSLAGSWSADQLTDGFVPDYIAARIDDDSETHAAELVKARLWHATEKNGEPGWQFHEWENFQPTREQVEAKREAARERMARVRGNRKAGSQEVRANDERTSQEVLLTPALPIPSNKETAAPAAADAEFEEFWDQYPRKVGKAKAAKAYAKARAKFHAEPILTGLAKHLPIWAATEEKFIPHATTWLNGERWTDAVEAPKPQQQGPRDQWARAVVVGGDQ